jgi:hypothetical protein
MDPTILASAADGDEWSVLHPNHFAPMIKMGQEVKWAPDLICIL